MSSILAWLSVMTGMSAPGMMTSRPTPAFWRGGFTASSDSGLRTKGNASANARRFSLHASTTQPPMRSSSDEAASASSRYGSDGSAEASSARPSAAGSAGESGAFGATTSPLGMGWPCCAAMSETIEGSVVTTMTGTPAARSCSAKKPTRSFKPATMTAMSSPSNGANGLPSRYVSETRAWGDALANAWRTWACRSLGAVSSKYTLAESAVWRASSMSSASSITALMSTGSCITAPFLTAWIRCGSTPSRSSRSW